MGKQGFASMTPEQRRAIASRGGKAAHEKGVAHQWNSAEASVAGRKGGLSMARRLREKQRQEIAEMEARSGADQHK